MDKLVVDVNGSLRSVLKNFHLDAIMLLQKSGHDATALYTRTTIYISTVIPATISITLEEHLVKQFLQLTHFHMKIYLFYTITHAFILS